MEGLGLEKKALLKFAIILAAEQEAVGPHLRQYIESLERERTVSKVTGTKSQIEVT